MQKDNTIWKCQEMCDYSSKIFDRDQHLNGYSNTSPRLLRSNCNYQEFGLELMIVSLFP
jgi:hypothetical protein